ncbi:hypothetical protein [Emticicia sp.]|uniref:hypothetical protein n=1 Tax=Emticicia sp. TaxID=1930953 RepID=UPI003752FF84
MKSLIGLLCICSILISCNTASTSKPKINPLLGTWQLLSGTTIEKGDTVITNYTKNQSFIKIINETHFAFLLHDLKKGKDSTSTFSSGGGTYSLTDSIYVEHLEYCSDRNWEGNDFTFIVTIMGDTLVQQGIEKVENAGVNRINIEKYIRAKK